MNNNIMDEFEKELQKILNKRIKEEMGKRISKAKKEKTEESQK